MNIFLSRIYGGLLVPDTSLQVYITAARATPSVGSWIAVMNLLVLLLSVITSAAPQTTIPSKLTYVANSEVFKYLKPRYRSDIPWLNIVFAVMGCSSRTAPSLRCNMYRR
ncbi:uncharacterized protein LOC135105586 [Scylla paramamosain]|uniref:uncharacterized protein LOC135105586 n=1 Tax=Scylla paramamosain TaxID=85552 RepID=UPI0030827F0A